MKQKSFLFVILSLLFSCHFFSLQAEDLEYLFTSTAAYTGGGSLTGGSAYEMPAGTNSYVGWIWFPYGFIIDSGSTSGLNVIPAINGTINLNDGTLSMTGDVLLASNGMISGDGNIDGQGHALKLCDELSLNSTLTFISDIIIDGGNSGITLGSDAQLWVSDNITVSFQNAIIKDLDSLVQNKIVMMGTGSKLAFDNVTIWLDGGYSFTQGSLYFFNDVSIAGPSHSFIYLSEEPSYITKQAKLTIDHRVTLSYNAPTNNKLVMTDDSSRFALTGCTLHTTPTGLQLTKGTLIIDHIVEFEGEANSSDGAIIFGDETAANDLAIEVMPGGNIKLNYGYLSYKNTL